MNADRLAPEKTERRQSFRNSSSTIANYEVINMLTQQILKELVQYNPDTGEFHRIGKKSDEPIGTKSLHSKKTYIRIWVYGKLHYAHRLAWLYMTGSFPKEQIDHIDGNGLNNAFANLRDVTCQENNKNRRLSDASSTGIMGVCWDEDRKKWRSQVKHSGKNKFLGRFDKIEDAKQAREEACERLGFHENHGNERINLEEE